MRAQLSVRAWSWLVVLSVRGTDSSRLGAVLEPLPAPGVGQGLSRDRHV